MLKNYLKITLRNLWKFKTYSLINIIGLSIGIAACLFITFYIVDEMNYDRYHNDYHRIYRIYRELENDMGKI